MKKAITWKRTTALATCSLMLAAAAVGGLATMDLGTASAAASSYTVDLSKRMQEFDGWGLSLSWWATEIGGWTRTGSSGKQKREEIAEALFGKSGLNLNIARYNVGGGDNPSHIHMSDDRNTPGWRNATIETREDPEGRVDPYEVTVLDDYVFHDENGNDIPWQELQNLDVRNDYRQLWVLDWIQNEHGVNGQNDYISEYYSNSPPWWMTMTGCTSGGVGGGQNLDYANNQAFVEYFLDVYEYLTSQGFTFGNLQPFNESGSDFWGMNGDQEGCYFSPEQKVIVLHALKKELEERGLDVPYNWGDETNTNVAYDQYIDAVGRTTTKTPDGSSAVGSDVVRGADRYTYHIYWYDNSGVQRMYRTAQADGKEIYMSEICWSDGADDGTAAYDPESLTTGLHYTQSIIDTVKHGGVDGYVFWQGMEDMVGQMKGHTNYGLIQGVYYTQEEAEEQGVDLASMGLTYQDYVLAKTYYLCGQYTKYIRPGYQIVDVNEDNTIAAVSPDGQTLVIVKQNSGNEPQSIRFDLNGFKAQSVEKIVTDKNNNWGHSRVSASSGAITDRVSARSVTTYVVHGNTTAGENRFVDESAMKKVNDLNTIKTALTEGGETEQFYYSGFSTNGGNARYYGDTLNVNSSNTDGYIAFRFNGTGFGIAAPAKSDAGQFDVWVDHDPATDAADYHKDFYLANQSNGYTQYVTGLDEGWHTVYLKAAQGSHGSWVNLDGLFIQTSAGAEAAGTLEITSASGIGGEIGFNCTVEGYEGYTVYAEYLENGATGWTRTAALEAEATSGKITGVEGNSVRLRLVAVKDGETVYSAERVVKVQQRADGILYFVDCGTFDPNSVAEGAVLGELQSVSDQAYGADPLTGKQWGYTNTLTRASASYYEDYEAMTSVMTLEFVEESALTYQFTLPAGTYNVTLGFYGGGSGWGTREEKVTIGSEPTAYIAVKQNTYGSVSKTVTLAEEGTLTVSVEKRDAAQDNSLLSVIVISEEGATALPLYTDAISAYNTDANASEDIMIGADVLAAAKGKSFTLYKTDGSSVSLDAADAKITVSAPSLRVNQNAVATYEFAEVTCTYNFRWMQEGGTQLYYNIDCAFTGNGTPPEDGTLLGTRQSTTHDREYGEDSTGYSWGYVGSNFNNGTTWVDDKDAEWSIREGKDAGQSVTYKMTGFKPNELLRIDIAAHCSNWGTRTANVLCNNVSVGDFEIISVEGGTITRKSFEGENVKADASGVLEFKLAKKTGDGPQIGRIRVYSTAASYEASKPVTAAKTNVSREDTVTLGGLESGAFVYILDENGVLLNTFRPTGPTKDIAVGDILPETSYELHITQSKENKSDPSPELVLSVEKEEIPEIEYIVEPGFVQEGDAVVVRFVPHTSLGVTSLVLKAPDGVSYSMTEGFFFRATLNGEYTITLVSGGKTATQTFTINTVDALELNAEYSATGWTDQNVTVTLAPESASGPVASVEIDGVAATAAEGKYSFTASENGSHTVKVVTAAGFEYERTLEVTNIDKSAPTLSLNVSLSASGVNVGFEAAAASGGKLYVEFNGAKSEVTEKDTFSLEEAGKYEIYFTNSVGVSTAKSVYYVTYGVENAQFADIAVAADGLVTVTAKARADLVSKLYRAGTEEPIESFKADKAGKYYVDIENGGEHELVTFYVRAAAFGGGTGTSDIIGGEEGMNGGIIAAIVIGCAAVVASAIACTVIIVKRRKNA